MSDFRDLTPVQMAVEPQTRLLVVTQGENIIKLTRDDVNSLQKLRNGEFNEIGPKGEKLLGAFRTKLIPQSRCTVDENGNISIVCKDEYENNSIVLANHKKLNDLQRVLDFVKKNNSRIAWSKEFRGRY